MDNKNKGIIINSVISTSIGQIFLYGISIVGSIMIIIFSWLSPIVKQIGVPLSILCGLTIFIWLFIGVMSIINRRKKPSIKLEEIIRKKFTNQTIRLDGKKFVDCQFDACTIEYSGGDFILDNSDIGEDCRLYFMTRESFATANLIYNFAFLRNQHNQLFILDKYGRIQKQPAIIKK